MAAEGEYRLKWFFLFSLIDTVTLVNKFGGRNFPREKWKREYLTKYDMVFRCKTFVLISHRGYEIQWKFEMKVRKKQTYLWVKITSLKILTKNIRLESFHDVRRLHILIRKYFNFKIMSLARNLFSLQRPMCVAV